MKNVTKILLAILALALLIFISANIYASKNPSLDTLRARTEEARQREIKAQKDREIREDALSQALYDQCYSESLALSGARFEEKQKRAYECWKSTTWTVTPATSGVPQRVSNPSPTSKNGKPKSLPLPVAHPPTPAHWNQVPTAPKAEGKGVAGAHPDRQPIPGRPNGNPDGNTGKKGSKDDYWKAYQVAVDQIHKWEGLRLSAYPDYRGCSIGWWTKAKSCREKITAGEADARLSAIVKTLLARVRKNFPNLHPAGQGALVSFAYNCHAGYVDVERRGLSHHSLWYKTAGGKTLGGLVKRRAEEDRLLFSKK